MYSLSECFIGSDYFYAGANRQIKTYLCLIKPCTSVCFWSSLGPFFFVRVRTGRDLSCDLTGSLPSYLAAGPLCWEATTTTCEGRRACMDTRARCACVAALLACLVVPVDPPWTVKTLPMVRSGPPADPLAGVDPPALAPPPLDGVPEPVPRPVAVLPDPDPLVGVMAVPGACWLGAGTGHALWHSTRVMKLLLLPWQPPYQKCTHLEVMTS